MHRTTAAGVVGGFPPTASAAVAMRAGICPGGMNIGSSTSITGPPAGNSVAAASRAARSCGWPASDHARIDSCSSHRPHVLRRNRVRPSTPPSFVKLARPAAVCDDRPVELQSDERPGATRDVGEVAVDGGNRHDRRRRVVRAHRRDDCGRRQSQLRAQLLPHGAPHLTRLLERGQQPGRDSETRQQLARPLPAPGVDEPGRRCVRGLGAQLAREPERQQVGEQHDVGGTGETAAALVGHELVQRVERQELLPVDRVEVGGVDDPMDVVDDLARAVVAIGDRLVDELSVAVEQARSRRPRCRRRSTPRRDTRWPTCRDR